MKKWGEKMTRKPYSVEFKVTVCEDYLNSDMTYEELAGNQHKYRTLRRWHQKTA